MKLRGIALFAAVALLAGCVSSGGPARPTTPGPPPVDVRLHATLTFAVVDADTGRPIEGARVDVDQVEGEDDGLTDGNGYWSVQLRQAPAVDYEVHRAGYIHAAGTAPLEGPADFVTDPPVRVELHRDAPPVPDLRPLVTCHRRYFCAGGEIVDYREVSAFALYARWLKGEQAHVAGYARALRAEGATALRVILTLGGPFWDSRGLHVGPDQGERFYAELPAFVDAVAREGLYVRLTLIGALEPLGGSVPDRRDHYTSAVHAAARAYVDRVARAVGDRPFVLFEVANEWNQIGMAESADRVRELGRLVKAAAPGRLLNLSNTNGPIADDPTFATAPADFVDAHLDRRKGMAGFEWVKRASESPVVDQDLMAFLSGEPINFGTPGVAGPGDVERSPAVACAYGAVSRVKQFYTTFHYDGGLWGDLPDAVTLETLRAWRACLDAIPLAAVGPGSSWCNGHHGCSPWRADSFPDSDDVDGFAGPVRIFGRVGPEGYWSISIREPARWRAGDHLKPGHALTEVARVEYGGWAAVVRREP